MAPNHSKADINRFSQALNLVRGHTNQPLFEMWFQGLILVRRQPHSLVIGTPNRFVAGWLEETQPRDLLQTCVKKAFGEELSLSLEVLPRKSSQPRLADHRSAASGTEPGSQERRPGSHTLPLFTPKPARPAAKRDLRAQGKVVRSRAAKPSHLRRAATKKISEKAADPTQPLAWEVVTSQWQDASVGSSAPRLLRARVPGGWLLALHDSRVPREDGPALTWYPDPDHRWSVAAERQELALSRP